MSAKRDNEGKIRYSLIPKAAKDRMAEALMYGAELYGEFNWKSGGDKLSILKLCDSLERHLEKFKEGEDFDGESKLHHIGHVLANAAFLAEFIDKGTGVDDRYQPDDEKFPGIVSYLDSIESSYIQSQFDLWRGCRKHYQISEDETLL